MNWIQVFAIIAVNIGLISWVRSDTRAFETKVEALIKEIKDEMKDFHGRLYAVEERNKGK